MVFLWNLQTLPSDLSAAQASPAILVRDAVAVAPLFEWWFKLCYSAPRYAMDGVQFSTKVVQRVDDATESEAPRLKVNRPIKRHKLIIL